MSGKFVKGTWIEDPKPFSDPILERDLNPIRIQESREILDKAIDDALICEHKRLMAIEYKIQKAGFWSRLKYLITGKL